MALPIVQGVTPAALTAKLAQIFANGTAAVGLEVGADAGLSVNEYIRIPLNMRKRWFARPSTVTSDHTGDFNAPAPAGWVSGGSIRVVDGEFHHVTATGSVRINRLVCEPPSFEDACAFVNANRGAISEGSYDAKHEWWVHAIRFWGVVAGLVKQDHSVEWVEVAQVDAAVITAQDVNDAAQIIDYGPNALTAAAARASSWRKTNHCTGGQNAGGFPRRWLQKEGYWPNTGDAATRRAEEVKVTTAFYKATHGISVHAALALMAPTDPGHWCVVDPQYGMMLNWDVKESVRIRIAPMTQVAGASVVVDSCVVAESLVKDALWPLVVNQQQLRPLVEARDVVEGAGVACAVYSTWFLNGHPKALAAVPFNQKDTTFFALAAELAIIATTYYKGTTIADSPSLRNAAGQSSDDSVRTMWGAIAREKARATPLQALTAYSRLAGALGTDYLVRLSGDDDTEITEGTAGAQDTIDYAAGLLGVTAKPNLNAADIVTRKKATAAAASSLAAALARP